MRNLKNCAVACILALSGAAAFPSDSATWGPIYASGPCKGLYQDECVLTMQYKQKEAENKAAQELQYQKAREEEAIHQKTKEDNQEKQQAIWADARAKEHAKQEAWQAVYAKQREAEDRAQAMSDRKAAAAASDRKAKCGEDYKAPRIGMSIDRIRSCVTTVKLTGQLNRADGVVSTYEGGQAYFHVMEGRVVSWGRY